MVDRQGREMFHPHVMQASFGLRYSERDRRLGMNIAIRRGFHPQPIMTINEKVYPVTLEERGWRNAVRVYADVGAREFERDWFDALNGRIVTLSGRHAANPQRPAEVQTLRVQNASFGTYQRDVVADDGSTASHAGYEGRLVLRETIGSLVRRQLMLVVEDSFVIAATALAAGVVGYVMALLPARRRRRVSG